MKDLQALELKDGTKMPNFAAHLAKHKVADNLSRTSTRVMQLNIGYYCNQGFEH
jgi:hypothetical protein